MSAPSDTLDNDWGHDMKLLPASAGPILTQPTVAERIKLLQSAANEEANHLFDEFVASLAALDRMADEIMSLGNGFAEISASARELRPQIQRWAAVAQSVQQKRRLR